MKPCCLLFLLPLLFGLCRPKLESPVFTFAGKPEIPASIKQEHNELLDKIHQISLWKDSTGRAAIKLKELMQHHFKEEEDYVLPTLGLLPSLANGTLPANSDEIIRMTDELKFQSTHLGMEHQFIKAYLDEMLQAAAKEGHTGLEAFEKAIHKHARMEEEILFPAAILAGEYLKLKSKDK